MLFWILAGVLAAGAALLVAARGAQAARRAATPAPDPALAVHARQLAELDALAARGLLAEPERAAARTEAARRLLKAADRATPPERPGGPGSRRIVTTAAACAGVAALGLYLLLGRPGTGDEPYAQRLVAWRATNPAALDPPRLAAVLAALAADRPRDPKVWDFLGRAQLAAGQPGEAASAFARAARLDPRSGEYPSQAGEALMQGSQGKVPPEAEAAFRQALARDPRNADARFYLARLRMARGDTAGGLADWRALLTDLAPDDPRRPALQAEIGRAESPAAAPAGALSAEAVARAAGALPAGGPEQAAFIRGMVASLAARLDARPDDVDGWARLVRAYRVLGDVPAEAKALARARAVFAGRPKDLVRVEAEAR